MRRPTDKISVAILLPFPQYAFDSSLSLLPKNCMTFRQKYLFTAKSTDGLQASYCSQFFYDYILYCSLTHL